MLCVKDANTKSELSNIWLMEVEKDALRAASGTD